jgi:quinol monooxygenase YgiN
MIRNTIAIDVKGKKKDTALEILRGLVEPTRSERGCVDCYLCENVMNSGQIRFATNWNDRQSLDRYVQSSSYTQILAAMDMASKSPEIRFDIVSETYGLEYVFALRCGEAASVAKQE